MSKPATDLTPRQAQELMSQLLDGELSPANADRLNAYLEVHPKSMDWMEAVDAIRAKNTDPSPTVDDERVAQRVLESISPRPSANDAPASRSGSLLSFPKLLRPLAAAAALAIVGIVSWKSLQTAPEEEAEFFAMQGSQVEFVSTDIPDASPVVYTDSETGWTVVWVEQLEPIPEEV